MIETVTTQCGCKLRRGSWTKVMCDHGRIFVISSYYPFWIKEITERPTTVCLCGSTRFYEAFQKANFEETMKGKIVLSVGFYPHSSSQAHGEGIGITSEQKKDLDLLHPRKIDLADEVLVLNVDGYIGESTARELAYAKAMGKTIRFLEGDDD